MWNSIVFWRLVWFPEASLYNECAMRWGGGGGSYLWLLDKHLFSLFLSLLCVNNSLFISMCILRDLPQQKNPRALCRTAPQFHMFPHSHGNISLLHTGRFPYLCVLLRLRNNLGLIPLGGPPSGERTGARTSPATWYTYTIARIQNKSRYTCILGALQFASISQWRLNHYLYV